MRGCSARAQLLDCLRDQIAQVEAPARRHDSLPFGMAVIDDRLHDAGLSRAALHEFAAAGPRLAEDAAATLFVAGLAARLAATRGTVLWAVRDFDLYAPGLEQAGLTPDRTLFVEARDDDTVLAVMEDALGHGALAAVIGEARRASMTATRRLQLAAADRRTPALLLRRWRKTGSCPLAEPSAATTRWRIGCAPSAQAPGVGRAHWRIELARQRSGEPFNLVVEACDDQGRLALPAAAADRAAVPGRATARAA